MPINYVSDRAIINQKKFNGGLNTASGPLGLQENESSDLQNIDFDKFGSFSMRNGFTRLNSTASSGSVNSDGLFWFEYDVSGTITRKAIKVTNGAILKMDALDGTWDTITGTATVTADNFVDFESFLNSVMGANGTDIPFVSAAAANAAPMTVPANLTAARFVKQFQNFTLLANVTVSTVKHGSRFYWSSIKTLDTWATADFIDVSKDDGEVIEGFKVLGEALIIFKTRSIYKVSFTGDRDIPFIVVKTPSNRGTIAPFSIQEIENGLVFLAYDGLYFFDGNNSFKISDKINPTLLGFNRTRFPNIVSMAQIDKNRYWLGTTTSGGSTNDRVVIWDWFNNAFSIYKGIDASAMAIFLVSGIEERPYFSDYVGFDYRADTGTSDNPSGTATAIDAFLYTNWKAYEDLVDEKGVAHVVIYHQIASTVLTFAFSYDFDSDDQHTQKFSIATSTDVYGTGTYGTATYASEGGGVKRRDLTGRGRVVRLKFANATLDETFQIDGIGTVVQAETFT